MRSRNMCQNISRRRLTRNPSGMLVRTCLSVRARVVKYERGKENLFSNCILTDIQTPLGSFLLMLLYIYTLAYVCVLTWLHFYSLDLLLRQILCKIFNLCFRDLSQLRNEVKNCMYEVPFNVYVKNALKNVAGLVDSQAEILCLNPGY